MKMFWRTRICALKVKEKNACIQSISVFQRWNIWQRCWIGVRKCYIHNVHIHHTISYWGKSILRNQNQVRNDDDNLKPPFRYDIPTMAGCCQTPKTICYTHAQKTIGQKESKRIETTVPDVHSNSHLWTVVCLFIFTLIFFISNQFHC